MGENTHIIDYCIFFSENVAGFRVRKRRLLSGLLVTELLSPFVLKLVFEKYTGSKKLHLYKRIKIVFSGRRLSILSACSTHACNAYYGLMLALEVDRRLLKDMEIMNGESDIRLRH